MTAASGQPEPVYTLHCRADDGDEVLYYYNPHTSELLDEGGMSVLDEISPRSYEKVNAVSPANPGKKSSAPSTLKIQLGLRCNYSCSYCSQASEIPAAANTRTADADAFLGELDRWLTGAPSRIEFWGGEPLLYFAKLKRLVPALRRRFPKATFVIVTNGSLVDEEIIEFIERYDILIAVSHDGPGQSLRGPDPFEDPARARWLRELWRRRGPAGRMTFNIVFSGANSDIGATRAWFVERLGDADVALSTEGVVSVHDQASINGPGRFTAPQMETLRRSVVKAFEEDTIEQHPDILEKAEDFVDSLSTLRPSHALGQKCRMDREDQIAVDLTGEVMTCQSTGSKGRHRIGSVRDLEGVRLNTAWHWSHRECCNYCPVLQLCKGACMFLEGDFFAQTCENEYHYNSAILAGVIKRATGLNLERITGDIRRPKLRRRIPIRDAGAKPKEPVK